MSIDNRNAESFDERDPARRLRGVRDALHSKAGVALAAAGVGTAPTPAEAAAPASTGDENPPPGDGDLAALRARIAEERGVPQELADRLSGSTAEEITTNADDLLLTIARTGASDGLNFDQGTIGRPAAPRSSRYVIDEDGRGGFVPDAHGAGIAPGHDVAGSLAEKAGRAFDDARH